MTNRLRRGVGIEQVVRSNRTSPGAVEPWLTTERRTVRVVAINSAAGTPSPATSPITSAELSVGQRQQVVQIASDNMRRLVVGADRPARRSYDLTRQECLLDIARDSQLLSRRSRSAVVRSSATYDSRKWTAHAVDLFCQRLELITGADLDGWSSTPWPIRAAPARRLRIGRTILPAAMRLPISATASPTASKPRAPANDGSQDWSECLLNGLFGKDEPVQWPDQSYASELVARSRLRRSCRPHRSATATPPGPGAVWKIRLRSTRLISGCAISVPSRRPRTPAQAGRRGCAKRHPR